MALTTWSLPGGRPMTMSAEPFESGWHGNAIRTCAQWLACEHHHLLLHEGGWHLQPQQDISGRRRWIAVHDDGRVVTPSPATAGDAEDLREAHEADIAPDTVTGTWGGERLDLAYAVSVYA